MSRLSRGLAALILVLGLPLGCAPPPPEAPPGELDQASGEDAMRAGQYAVADEFFQRAYVRGGDPRTALLWQARAQLALGALGECRDRLGRLLDLAPSHVEGRVLQVRLDLLLGEYDDALAHMEALEKVAPAEPSLAVSRAELYLSIGYPERARREIVAGKAAHPEQAEWPFLEAATAVSRGDLPAGRGGLAAAARSRKDGASYVRGAYAADLMGEHDQAERGYLDAAVHADGNPVAFSFSSDFYAAIGRYPDAVSDLGHLEHAQGHASPDLTRRIAGLLVRGGRQPEAQGLLKPYLLRRVEDRSAARELALSYLLEGKDTEATATLEVLVSQDRDAPLTQYLAGAARLRGGDFSGARGAFLEAARLGATGYPVELALAATALALGDAFDAEFQARRRLDRAPEDWLAGAVWAAARKFQGQVAAARFIRERVAAKFPSHADDIRALVPLPDAPPSAPLQALNLPMEQLDRLFPPPVPGSAP